MVTHTIVHLGAEFRVNPEIVQTTNGQSAAHLQSFILDKQIGFLDFDHNKLGRTAAVCFIFLAILCS